MKTKGKEQEQEELNFYVIDTLHERTAYDTVYKYVVDKDTFKKYFPNWNDNNNSKPKLQPKRKKA